MTRPAKAGLVTYTEPLASIKKMKIEGFISFLLFFIIPIYGNTQSEIEVKKNECFDFQEMKITRNIYSSPNELENPKYDSVKFYVLEEKNLPDKKHKYRSNGFIVNDFKNKGTKYQRAIFANYSEDTISITSYFVRGLFLIQEALDTNQNWQPIEAYNVGMSCPVGEVDEFKIMPNEYLNIYVARYCGEFKTKLRLKLVTNNSIIYSQEFDGSINLSQFQKLNPNKEKWIYPSFFEKKEN